MNSNDQFVDRVIVAIGESEEYLEGIADFVDAHGYLNPEEIGEAEAKAMERIASHLMDAYDAIAALRIRYEDRLYRDAKAKAEADALAQQFAE